MSEERQLHHFRKTRGTESGKQQPPSLGPAFYLFAMGVEVTNGVKGKEA